MTPDYRCHCPKCGGFKCHCLRCGGNWTPTGPARPKKCRWCGRDFWWIAAGVLRPGPVPKLVAAPAAPVPMKKWVAAE